MCKSRLSRDGTIRGIFALCFGVAMLFLLARAGNRLGNTTFMSTTSAERSPAPGHTSMEHVSTSRAPGLATIRLPLNFIPNVGQADSKVRFQIKGAGHTISFTPQEIVFRAMTRSDEDVTSSSDLRLHFAGSNPEPTIEGLQKLPGTANFFLGNDPSKWHANVPTYQAIIYHDLYPGIDLTYSGENGHLKGEFRLSPGANPNLIQMAYQGGQSTHIREDGALALQTSLGELVEEAPVVYQEIHGRRVEVEGHYRLLGEGRVGFTLQKIDSAFPIVIDPLLNYSTYLGGNNMDTGNDIAVDAAGNVYLTGQTASADFPATYGSLTGGSQDAFVAKINAAGTALVYATYLGGSADDAGYGIAVDPSGNAYITGQTLSTDFPPTTGAFTDRLAGGADAFVVKLNTGGSALLYATYLGGSSDDSGNDIAVDSAGKAHVVGQTDSSDFPVTNSVFQKVYALNTDTFVTKLDAGGSALEYSSYLGGSNVDYGNGIALDSAGNAYVVGVTASTDFVTTTGAYTTSFAGGAKDAFVTKVVPDGSSLSYSTYLGGENYDLGYGIAVDNAGYAYVTGQTASLTFPHTSGAFSNYSFGGDAFVTKLNATGSDLVYSTYLGGSGEDIGNGIALNGFGNAYVTGRTVSTNFPTTTVIPQETLAGSADSFVTKINSDGTGLDYSTYLGGSGYDEAQGIAVDVFGGAYVTGQTNATDFPTTTLALQKTFAGGVADAFVAKIRTQIGPTTVSIHGLTSGLVHATYTFSATVEPPTATLPFTYTWQATAQVPVTHTGRGLDDIAAFMWTTAGSKTITVTAANDAGQVSAQRLFTATVIVNAPAGIAISGPTEGLANAAYTFTATVEPPTTTQPLTYTWQATAQVPVTHTGKGLDDMAAFTWTTAGSKTITVTAANNIGQVSAQHPFTVTVIVNAPAGIAVAGPTEGLANTAYTFTATVEPPTTTLPLTYTWQATGQSLTTHGNSELTDTASFTWATAGSKTITVTAANDIGQVSAQHPFTVTVVVNAPAGIAVAGPTEGLANTAYTFTATVEPPTTTLPLTYTWQATGQSLTTHGDSGLTDTASFTWATAGSKMITVTTGNAGGSSHTVHVIAVKQYQLYLPMVIKSQS